MKPYHDAAVYWTFVDWGDGYFVYKDGRYLGKDDQIHMVNILEQSNGKSLVYEKIDMPEDWDYYPPEELSQ